VFNRLELLNRPGTRGIVLAVPPVLQCLQVLRLDSQIEREDMTDVNFTRRFCNLKSDGCVHDVINGKPMFFTTAQTFEIIGSRKHAMERSFPTGAMIYTITDLARKYTVHSDDVCCEVTL
jgi:hypothetical protein